jgi:hypothetical protein
MAEFLRVAVTDEDTQIFSAQNVNLVEQASATTTVITYGGGSSAGDVLTITHSTTGGTGVESMRNAVQDALIKAFDQSYGNAPVIDIQLPTGITVSGIAIA